MTFFLSQGGQAPTIQATNPEIDVPTWSQGAMAGGRAAALENDANFIARKQTQRSRADRGWEIANRLGSEAVIERARDLGYSEERLGLIPQMMERRPPNMAPEMEQLLTEMGREAATLNPDQWGDVDLSEEAITARTNEALQAEYEDAQQILEMMPNGRGMAEFVGGMVGITADVKNLPFLIMGGGSGSLMRVIGREAMINTAAEGAFMPAQFSQAQRLDIPDPDVVTQLALAAVAGGAFGGVVEGTARSISYWRGRNAVTPIPGHSEFETIRLVDEVEDILASDNPNPVAQINRLLVEVEHRRVEPTPTTPAQMPEIADFARTTDAAFPPDLRPSRVDVSAALTSNAQYAQARAAAPGVMRQFEALTARRDTYRRWMDELTSEANRGNTLAVIDARISELEDTLRATQGKNNKAKIRADLREVKADRSALLATDPRAETPDTRELRRAIQQVDEQMRDIAPEVGAAFRSAEPIETPNLPRAPDTDAAEVDRMMEQFLTDQPALGHVDFEMPANPRQQPELAGGAPAVRAPFDEPAAPRVEAFSEPASTDARTLQDTVADDLRTQIERDGDLTMDFGDGRGERSMAAALDELDQLDDFTEIMALCGRPKAVA